MHGDQLFPENTLGVMYPRTDKERVTQRRPCPEWRAVSGTQGRAECECFQKATVVGQVWGRRSAPSTPQSVADSSVVNPNCAYVLWPADRKP